MFRLLKKSSFPGYSKRALPSPRKAVLRAGRQMQVELCEIPSAGGPRDAFHLPIRQAILRVASRRLRSDILPRLRAETSALVRCPKLSTPWASSQANEGRHADELVSRPEAYLEAHRNKPAPCLTRGRMREIPRSAGLMDLLQQLLGPGVS